MGAKPGLGLRAAAGFASDGQTPKCRGTSTLTGQCLLNASCVKLVITEY